MKTKNQTIGLPAVATIVSAAQEWLKSDNRICSAIMAERVSNLQTLHYVHIGVPALLGLCCMNLACTMLLFAWSACAFMLARKEGEV